MARLEAEFDRLAYGPQALAVDGREIRCGLPARRIDLGELRALLLHPSADFTLKDAVWRALVQRARVEGGDWMTGCLGMALPGLRSLAAHLIRQSPGRLTDDIESELISGFLARLPKIDLTKGRIAVRLMLWGRKAALQVLERERRYEPVDPAEMVQRAGTIGPLPARDPDGQASSSLVEPSDLVEQAVQRGFITPDEAELITATRLDGRRLRDYARAYGEAQSRLYSRRSRAEDRLVAAISSGQVSAISARPSVNLGP
ncbi:hypothetical protein ACFQ07_33520 [Actinomadura adrarensis]|uniref:Sigma-70 family RNA polymerase sigma factor n=1 Tax=Actinomadura adrarensis TaxID=1819600 RepID=A0ABW3CRW8_9ACTN